MVSSLVCTSLNSRSGRLEIDKAGALASRPGDLAAANCENSPFNSRRTPSDLPLGPPSGRSGGLKQLHQIALRVLERCDPYGTVIRGVLEELDPGVLQALPVTRKVVAGETDHMPSRIGIATMHLAVRAQPEPAEDYETGRFRGHLESQNVPIKWQQAIQVFAPDRRSAQPCDHRGGSYLAPRQRRSVECCPFGCWELNDGLVARSTRRSTC